MSNKKKLTFEEVLSDIELRFLLNVPGEECEDAERLFFQIEQAHWFYEDFVADHHKHLPHLSFESFAKKLFEASELLQHLRPRFDKLYAKFSGYKISIPVYGCIYLTPAMDKFLMVRNWRGKSWGFPKGKINEGEVEIVAAARESFEETGYDARPLIGTNLLEENKFVIMNGPKKVTVYVVTGVPEDFPFEPQTRKEVSKIDWFTFDTLPKQTWDVTPFMSKLRKWIKTHRRKRHGGRQKQQQQQQQQTVAPTTILKNPHHHPHAQNSHARSQFGTEDVRDFNVANSDTFHEYSKSSTSWSVEEMFKRNEQMTGRKFVYDGSAQDFGDPAQKSVVVDSDANGAMAPSVAALFNSSPPLQPDHTDSALAPSVAALLGAAANTGNSSHQQPHLQQSKQLSVQHLFASAAHVETASHHHQQQQHQQHQQHQQQQEDSVSAFFNAAKLGDFFMGSAAVSNNTPAASARSANSYPGLQPQPQTGSSAFQFDCSAIMGCMASADPPPAAPTKPHQADPMHQVPAPVKLMTNANGLLMPTLR